MSPLVMALLIVAAFLTATVSAILGMAGGAMLLAVLWIVNVPFAVPVHASIQLVSNVTRAFVYSRHIRWKPVLILMVAAAPMPWLVGMPLLSLLDEIAVRTVMGAWILYATWAPKWGIRGLREGPAFVIAGLLGGAFGVIFGAVGPLTAPFYLSGRFFKEQLIGTKAVCQAYLHVIKILAFLTWGDAPFTFDQHLVVIVPMATATIGGTFFGRWLLGFLSERAFFAIFKTVLTLLAVRLLLTPFV